MNSSIAYYELNGRHCVSSNLIVGNIASHHVWDKWVKNASKLGAVRQIGGNGRPALLEINAIPEKYRNEIINKYGKPEDVSNALLEHFSIDGTARM